MKAIDLFAGPGGWDLAATSLGLDPLGIEWDDAACATREAAGLRTLQADVVGLDPSDFEPCDLLIASPPCPSFSTAGKGDGIADMPLVYEAATAASRGKPVPELPWRDERSALVVEPLRWAVLLEPRFLAWEQVPPVLPFWEHCAELLRRKGWNVWTGIMEAERYGVPQTRERAILMADREAPVHPPRPTHQRYVKGEPQRHEVTFEGEVLPWVSMAEALGGAVEVFAGTHARARVLRANLSKWVYDRRAQNPDSSPVPPVPPVPTSEPAPTLTANGLAKGTHQWATERPAPTIVTTRRSKDGILVGRQLPPGEGENVGGHNWKPPELAACGCDIGVVDADGFCACCHAHLDDPNGLYALQGDGTHGHRDCPANWPAGRPAGRPATTVAGDPRIGRHDPEESGSQQKDAIRVSLEEAAILQSFPPDYPFQGTKSQRYLQVGNAVPPLLALSILSALLPAELLQQYEREQEAVKSVQT